MSEQLKDLAQLRALTDAKFVAVQSEMAALQQKERAIRAQLSDLVVRRATAAQRLQGGADAAAAAGADVRWHRWIDQRRKKLNQELSAILSDKAAIRVQLQKSFGRNEALRLLGLRLKEIARLEQSRRQL